MRSLGAYIEGLVGFISFSQGQTAPIWLFGPGLALWPFLKDICSSSMSWCFPILQNTIQPKVSEYLFAMAEGNFLKLPSESPGTIWTSMYNDDLRRCFFSQQVVQKIQM